MLISVVEAETLTVSFKGVSTRGRIDSSMGVIADDVEAESMQQVDEEILTGGRADGAIATWVTSAVEDEVVEDSIESGVTIGANESSTVVAVDKDSTDVTGVESFSGSVKDEDSVG